MTKAGNVPSRSTRGSRGNAGRHKGVPYDNPVRNTHGVSVRCHCGNLRVRSPGKLAGRRLGVSDDDIDTAAAVKRMAEAGLPREQAEAIVETFAESNDALVTKADLQAAVDHLQATVDKLEARLTVRIIAAQVATATLLFVLLRFFG